MTHAMIRDQGPVEILCNEIGFPFEAAMENERLFVEFVRKIVDEVAGMREIGERLSGAVGGAGPSEDSATVLQATRSMLAAPRHEMVAAAAEVHRLARDQQSWLQPTTNCRSRSI